MSKTKEIKSIPQLKAEINSAMTAKLEGYLANIDSIAVECMNGKTEYIELKAYFDDAGEWIKTTKVSKARVKHAKAR